jgi:hypothetical protein
VRIAVALVLVACGSSSAPPAPHVVEPARPADVASDAAPVVDAVTMGADAAPPLAIVDAPMTWSDERARLTLEYRRAHSDPNATDLAIDPRGIVLHYTAGAGSATATRQYFDNLRIEAARKDIARAGAVNVSSHFIVDRDGTIYRLQPETRFARHCIGLNHVAIGIENVGDEDRFPLTDAQVAADAALVRDLVRRFPKITHMWGHHEVTKQHPALYLELDPTYRNDKPDPGARFMAAVRAKVADLGLRSD